MLLLAGCPGSPFAVTTTPTDPGYNAPPKKSMKMLTKHIIIASLYAASLGCGIAKAQDLYVAGDNPGMGKIAGQYMIDRLGGKGDIVVLRGLPTVIDDQRFDTFMELIKNT